MTGSVQTGEEKSAVWTNPNSSRVEPVHWIALGAIALLALILRLRDPLSSTIMGAEDPYLHMARTWDLVQGHFPRDYPVGFMILLAPFTLVGPHAFYTLARFMPALLGVVMVAGTFQLLRHYMLPAGALTASLFLAVMPEAIMRTNLLVPTSADLAVTPFLFLALFRLIEGQRWAVYAFTGMMLGLLLTHPWYVALLMPPLTVFGLITLVSHRGRRSWAASGSAAAAIGLVGILWLFRQWQPSALLFGHAMPRFAQIVTSPSSIFPLPVHVDLPYMLTWPALGLAIVGAGFAIAHRSRIGLLALLWSAVLFPLTVVDWFDVWYIPHRTVAYLAIGVAILAGIAVAEIVKLVTATNIKIRNATALGVLALIALLTIPTAASVQPWYRIYDQDDFAAYHGLEDLHAQYVMAGSWQARAGYKALTGRDCDFMPDFFKDENFRAVQMRDHPDLVVLIDNYTIQSGYDLSWLHDWRTVGVWNDVSAYAPPQ